MGSPTRNLRRKLLNRFGRTGIGMRTMGRVRRTIQNERWAFILGCYNSGTTLLQRLLVSHPDIAGMPAEGIAFTDVILRPEEYGWTRMWWKCRERMESESDYTPEGARRLKSQWSWMLDKPSAPVALEKSIANVVHAEFLNEFFAGAKFIHIVRNGYVVSEGIRRKARPGFWGNPKYKETYPIELCAQQWVETLKTVKELKKKGVDVLELTYEELASDPDGTLNRVFSFLGLDSLALQVTDREWLVHGNHSKIENMNARSLAALSEEDIANIESVASEWLHKYHYA